MERNLHITYTYTCTTNDVLMVFRERERERERGGGMEAIRLLTIDTIDALSTRNTHPNKCGTITIPPSS